MARTVGIGARWVGDGGVAAGLGRIASAAGLLPHNANSAAAALVNLDRVGLHVARSAAAVAVGVGGFSVTTRLLRGAMEATIGSALGFEDSFAGIRKTVSLTEAEYKRVALANRQLAKEIPVTVLELNKIGEIGGQLGVEGEEGLRAFTETVARVRAASTLTTEEAATGFGKIAAATQLPINKIEKLGSAIIELGLSGASNESQILEFTQRLAGTVTLVGGAVAEAAGIAKAFSDVGVEPEAGATAIQKTLIEISEAASTGNSKLRVFAETAGLSAEAFAKIARDNPAKAFTLFIEGLRAAGKESFGILKQVELSDARVTRVLLTGATAGKNLANSIQTANDAFAKGDAVQRVSEARFDTTLNQLKILRNQAIDVGISFSSGMLPAIDSTSKSLGGFLGILQDIGPALETTAKAAALFGLLFAAKSGFGLSGAFAGSVGNATQGIIDKRAAQAANVTFAQSANTAASAIRAQQLALFTTIPTTAEYRQALLLMQGTNLTLAESMLQVRVQALSTAGAIGLQGKAAVQAAVYQKALRDASLAHQAASVVTPGTVIGGVAKSVGLLNGALIGLTLGFTGLDIAINKWKGYGVIDLLTGEGEAAKKAAKAQDELAKALERVNRARQGNFGLDDTEILQHEIDNKKSDFLNQIDDAIRADQDFRDAVLKYREASVETGPGKNPFAEGFAGRRDEINDVKNEIKSLTDLVVKGDFKDFNAAFDLIESNLSRGIKEPVILNTIKEAIREAREEVINGNDAYRIYAEQIKAIDTATGNWWSQQTDLNKSLSDAPAYIQEANDALSRNKDLAEDAAIALGTLGDAFDDLEDAFKFENAETALLDFQIAHLKRVQAEAQAAGGDLSDASKATLEQLEAQKKLLSDLLPDEAFKKFKAITFELFPELSQGQTVAAAEELANILTRISGNNPDLFTADNILLITDAVGRLELFRQEVLERFTSQGLDIPLSIITDFGDAQTQTLMKIFAGEPVDIKGIISELSLAADTELGLVAPKVGDIKGPSFSGALGKGEEIKVDVNDTEVEKFWAEFDKDISKTYYVDIVPSTKDPIGGLSPATPFLGGTLGDLINPRATGGITSGPEIALIGEDGPEAVLPLSKPTRMLEILKQIGIIPMASGGVVGGSPNVKIFNEPGDPPPSTNSEADRIASGYGKADDALAGLNVTLDFTDKAADKAQKEYERLLERIRDSADRGITRSEAKEFGLSDRQVVQLELNAARERELDVMFRQRISLQALATRFAGFTPEAMSVAIALGQIQEHLRETGQSINDFMQESAVAVLDGYRSAISDLAGATTREGGEQNLRLHDLELQALLLKREGATLEHVDNLGIPDKEQPSSKDLKLQRITDNIEGLEAEIAIREKEVQIMEDRAILADKTLITEKDLNLQFSLLTTATSTQSYLTAELNAKKFFEIVAVQDATAAVQNFTASLGGGSAAGFNDQEKAYINEVARQKNEPLPFANGGYGNFGAGTLAMLHGDEAILPLRDPKRVAQIMQAVVSGSGAGVSDSAAPVTVDLKIAVNPQVSIIQGGDKEQIIREAVRLSSEETERAMRRALYGGSFGAS